MFVDVLSNIEGSMCRMMTSFVSEDTQYPKEVSKNMFGGPIGSRNFFHGSQNEALRLLKRNFL